MRILVHYHAYGDAEKVPDLVAEHSGRIRHQINQKEAADIERAEAEYQPYQTRLAKINTETAELQAEIAREVTKAQRSKLEAKLSALASQSKKIGAKLAERDERIVEIRRRADEDRTAVSDVAHELGNLYGDPDELVKHARVVPLDEISDNEFNLNIPRYVDTFEPTARLDVGDALLALSTAERAAKESEQHLASLLIQAGYETK